MVDNIIEHYNVNDNVSTEVWYIPKLNTEVFKDGNGVPIIRRKVHSFTELDKVINLGCDSTDGHCCPLCTAWGNEMYNTQIHLGKMINELSKIQHKSGSIDELTADYKSKALSEVPFKLQEYVYIAFVKFDNGDAKEATSDIRLLKMKLSTYNAKFRHHLISSKKGVYLNVKCNNLSDKNVTADSLEVCFSSYKYNEFEEMAEREIRSVHFMDLMKLHSELGVTSFDSAKSIVRATSFKREEDFKSRQIGIRQAVENKSDTYEEYFK